MASPKLSRIFARAGPYMPSMRETSFMLFGFVTWIPALIFINSHVAEISWIKGASMYPYLNTDYHRNLKQDMCINWKWKPSEGLQRGMIVSFWSPYHPDKQVVKRIIALEGDRVYTRAPYPLPITEIPTGHVWVEGDGGKQSLDSHHYGPISKSLITGKIVYVVLPWSSFGTVRWDQYKGKTRVIKGQSHERLGWA